MHTGKVNVNMSLDTLSDVSTQKNLKITTSDKKNFNIQPGDILIYKNGRNYEPIRILENLGK